MEQSTAVSTQDAPCARSSYGDSVTRTVGVQVEHGKLVENEVAERSTDGVRAREVVEVMAGCAPAICTNSGREYRCEAMVEKASTAHQLLIGVTRP